MFKSQFVNQPLVRALCDLGSVSGEKCRHTPPTVSATKGIFYGEKVFPEYPLMDRKLYLLLKQPITAVYCSCC